jgi:hypothetical protein
MTIFRGAEAPGPGAIEIQAGVGSDVAKRCKFEACITFI